MPRKNKVNISSNSNNQRYHGWTSVYYPFDFQASRGGLLTFYHVATRNKCIFKAFISRLSENIDTGWSSEKTMGRMDEIQKYSNTTRKINVSFDVPAESEADGAHNLANLAELIKLQYPTYDEIDARASTINTPPLLRIKFGNMISRSKEEVGLGVEESGLLGTMTGLSWNFNKDMGFFNPYPGEFIPRFFDISFNFTVIHEHPLGWSSTEKDIEYTNQEISTEFEYFPYNMETIHNYIIESSENIYNDAGNKVDAILNTFNPNK